MAAVIPIDSNLNKSEEVADFLLFLLNDNRINLPKLSLPEILMAKARPGLSSEVLASSIISRFEEIGIPSGSLEGGHPNVMENYTKVLTEEIVGAIQTDMRIDIAVDAGMSVTTAGANAGGPVTSQGASTAPHTGVGVAR